VIGGEPTPDHDETIEVGWFHPDQFADIELGDFARSSFIALGLISG
jgi:hypothetical protein